MKLETSNKGNMQIKQKYEELKSMCAPKDELIARLENEMRELSVFVEKTIKVFFFEMLDLSSIIVFFQKITIPPRFLV